MSLSEFTGDVAACLTTLSFFPQAIRVIRTRDTRAISLVMYLLFTTGVALWGVFGIMTMQWSIIVANAITVILAAMILGIKIRDVAAQRGKPPA
ncbi:MAG: hypothetical protein GC155_13900 [Alphaproteobacteria bacterium]|nr:hypothetical protein [Alphaproteobacteria bacterium]